MKKRFVIILVFIILIVALFSIIKINTVTKKFTGEATSNNFVLQVNFVGPPLLSITNPKNQTYFQKDFIPLNFTSDPSNQSIWYNLDNGANTTVTGPIYFSTTNGLHTLYLFANNSNNNQTSKNITFFVNSTLFSITYTEYNGSTRGNSTEFRNYSYEELQNLSNFTLENGQNGKVTFSETINITNASNSTLNLDTYTDISFNRIEIDSTNLPNLNKPASLSLYGLSFTNPRVLKDGNVCSSSVCTSQSYSNGILTFSVTGFSVYSSEETPTSSSTGQATSEEIGSGPVKEFSVDKDNIHVKINEGQEKEESILVTNEGKQNISLEITSIELEDRIRLNKNYLELTPGQSEKIIITIDAINYVIPDIYTGKIILKTKKSQKEIPVVIEVDSEGALFDVQVSIPQEFLVIDKDRKVVSNIRLIEVGEVGKVDVEVEYALINYEGIKISLEKETIAVEGQINYVKTFKIPENLKEGPYILYVKATYEGKVASASSPLFLDYSDRKNTFRSQLISIIIISVIIILSIIIYLTKFVKIKKRK